MISFDAEGVRVRIDPDTLREVVQDPARLSAWCAAHPEDPRAVAYLRMLGRADAAARAGRHALADPSLTPLVRAVRRTRYAHVLQWRGDFAAAEEQFALAAEETGLDDPTSASSLSVLASVFQHRAKCRFEQGLVHRGAGEDEAADRSRRDALEDARRALALREHLAPSGDDAIASACTTVERLERVD